MSASKGSHAGFLELLCVLFIGLKLTGHVRWSWWWVLSPVWCPVLLVLLLLPVIRALEKD